MIRSIASLLLIVCVATLDVAAQGPSTTTRLRGAVVALEGNDLEVKADGGDVRTVRLLPGFRVSAWSRADLAAVAAGAFVGTTATPQADGTLVASEVHVFPESMRGTGEGHRPLSYEPRGTMTNATVTSVVPATGPGSERPRSTMTNATVASVAATTRGRRITLRYNDGEKVVFVPDSVPIVMVGEGSAAMLVSGAHVVLTATRGTDGALTADRIIVGKDGLVPPV